MKLGSVVVPTHASSWTGNPDGERVRTVEIQGFRRLLSFYGRDVNDQNFKDYGCYISFLFDPEDLRMYKVRLLIRINGETIEPSWTYLGTAVLDDGRRVYHCFQEPTCPTGLMR